MSLDFGPVGEADVTANLMEAVPCSLALHDPAELPEDTAALPFLHIKVPHHPAESAILSQVGILLPCVSNGEGKQPALHKAVHCLERGKAGMTLCAAIMPSATAKPYENFPAKCPYGGPHSCKVSIYRKVLCQSAWVFMAYGCVQAVEFAQSRQYHAFTNNCIQNTDFFIRALTGGAVRNAPLVHDALCGHVPAQDNPMLVMFMLMTGFSWCAFFSYPAAFKVTALHLINLEYSIAHGPSAVMMFRTT